MSPISTRRRNASLLFVSSESAVTDPVRIRALNRSLRLHYLIIGLCLFGMGAALGLFVIFFTLSNFLNIPGLPRIPALGLGVLPTMVAGGLGLGLINGFVQSPHREYLKKPDDFWILKAVVTKTVPTRTGWALRLTIGFDSPYHTADKNAPPEVWCVKINTGLWERGAIPPREARLIYSSRQTGEKALLAVLGRRGNGDE